VTTRARVGIIGPLNGRDEIPHVQAESASHETLVQILREQGCVVVDSLVTGASLAAARDEVKRVVAEVPVGERDFDGRATRRVYDPLARTRVLDDWVLHPLLTATVQALIGPSQFGMTILSEVQPGEVAQFLHRDAAIYPLPAEVGPVEVNTIWAIDEFTRANGATVVAPGSHVGGTRPSAYDRESLTVATMSAGSVLVYDGRVVHGAGGQRHHFGAPRTDRRAHGALAPPGGEPFPGRGARRGRHAPRANAGAARVQPTQRLSGVRGGESSGGVVARPGRLSRTEAPGLDRLNATAIRRGLAWQRGE